MSHIWAPSSPALASSPPARSPALPIKRVGGWPAPRSAPLPSERRSSETGGQGRGLSFSKGHTPFASLASSGRPSSGKPPVGPSSSAAPGARAAKPAAVVVGFAPTEAPPAPAALSPGRLATHKSLLSSALLDSGISPELYGSVAPAHTFQGLVVLPPHSHTGDASSAVDMARLLQLQAQHAVFSSSVVADAYAFAARAHAGQTRKSGEPVLAHLTATAAILAELGLPEEVVAAGLLHDVLCDTPTTPGALAAAMPPGVVSLVARVAQLNQLSQGYRDNAHSLEAEAMLDMLTGMDDVSALLIKLADRLHNMRTVGALSRCKQVRMASETLDVFAVLANRLGAWAIKAELEDLAFKTLNPEEYDLVAAAVAARAAAAAGPASGAAAGAGLAAGIERLTAALAGAGLEVVDVSGRVKNVYGVWKKVQKTLGGKRRRGGASSSAAGGDEAAVDDQDAAASPGEAAAAAAVAAAGTSPPQRRPSPAAAAAAAGCSPSSGAGGGACAAGAAARRAARAQAIADAVAQVYDIQALRVVVPHKHDCYAAMRVVQGLWDAMPGRVKDYIRQRKPNGYQSLHLTVRDAAGQPLEVQIRTPKMHYIAEYGFAAHWRYKERLGREDLWLDRLVQWKKWVASEKLGILDRKLRPSGSPGAAGGGDAALADLAQRLQLERAASGGGATGAAVEAAIAAATAGALGVGIGGSGGGDAVAEEFAAEVSARAREQQRRQQQRQLQLAAVPAGAGSRAIVARSPAAAAAAATAAASSPADEKFAARFRMRPISESELDQHGAAVMLRGPRGACIAQLPARCTVGQLLESSELADALRCAGGAGLAAPLQLAASTRGGGADSTGVRGPGASCLLAVNGVVVSPSQAHDVVLRAGDQVQLLEEPPRSLLGLGAPALGGAGSAADAAAGQRGAPLLPGAMAEAGGSLHLFVPGQGEPLEVALQHKLGVGSRVPLRAPALVS